ncbi:MAG: ABC transporter ATP-binding protein [Candidatus Bathyarchaeia archaeon]
MNEKLLTISDLKVYYYIEAEVIKAVDGVSFWVDEGKITGLVGESGCGKTTLALSILKLTPHPGRIIGGKIIYKGENLLEKEETELRKIRGSEISIIFQNPLTSLNPVYTIGDQVAETIMSHQSVGKEEAMEKAVEVLNLVGLPDPAEMRYKYPHELSGGMRQRVMISIAISCAPSLLIADEPTSFLDVTIQAQILRLLKFLNEKKGASTLLVTHNLGLVAEICDKVAVMYAGNVMEYGDVLPIFEDPKHPYTIGLIGAIPKIGGSSFIFKTIPGEVPSLSNPPRGCVFHPRCSAALGICKREKPSPIEETPGHVVYCHLFKEG